MEIGITLMLNDQAIDLLDLARAVEERGFASLYLPEHTHLPVRASEPPALVEGVQVTDYQRSFDPFVALAAAGAVTQRIRLGTGVALVAQHDPIVLAKAIATLDFLCRGRFVLGLGYGWNRDEMADHGVDFARRRDILREKMLCMRALWTQDEAEFHGEFVDLQPSYSWPKPVQTPAVRTLIGGAAGPKLFGAIAEFADGWIPVGGGGIAKALPDLRAAMESRGRDPDTLHIVPFGSIPDESKLAYYASIGVTEVVLRVPPPYDRDSVLSTLDRMTTFLAAA